MKKYCRKDFSIDYSRFH